MTVRVLLVDDHPVVRAGVRAVLDDESDLEVVGEADSSVCALELARKLRPDIIVADFLLPDGDGLTVAEHVRCELPETKVLILTGVGEESFPLIRAVRAGVVGYVTKDADTHGLVQIIRSAASGHVYPCARTAARLMHEIESPWRGASKAKVTSRKLVKCQDCAGQIWPFQKREHEL